MGCGPYTVAAGPSIGGVDAYVAGMDAPAPTTFRLSARAAARVAEIATAEGGGALRVAVLAGGCSGFQYKFGLDAAPAPDDLVIERDGARVFIDPASLDLLAGAELDYTDQLMGSHFTVRNPNVSSACGCGTSFAVG
jgi:iron-sulfur cluster assembly accessory protein